jgi:hypothetical protein
MVRSWPLRTSGQPRRQGAHEGICASDVGAYRSDLHLCRSTRTVRDEDKGALDGQLGLFSVGRSRPRFEALVDEVADETEAAAFRIVPA